MGNERVSKQNGVEALCDNCNIIIIIIIIKVEPGACIRVGAKLSTGGSIRPGPRR